jgi:hypothetical protein
MNTAKLAYTQHANYAQTKKADRKTLQNTEDNSSREMVKMNPLKWFRNRKQVKWERENEPYPTPQELEEFDRLDILEQEKYELELSNKCSKKCFKPLKNHPKECSNRKTCYC